jgi:nucleoside-diphosphate-sugar epimerase
MIMTGKKVLVTGATGMVGIHTLLRLKDMPDIEVRAVVHSKEPWIKADNISYVKADLTKMYDCNRVVEGIDYVLMFAARIDRRSTGLNPVLQTLLMNCQMLEAAYHASVKKYLWLSSAVAYPVTQGILSEELMFQGNPRDSHFALGWTTRYIEKLCETYASKLQKAMQTIILRPTAIYGPWGDFDFKTSHVLPTLIRRVVERQNPLEVWGTGETRRDFIYADDVVDACLLALENLTAFGAYNIGAGVSYGVKDLLQLILNIERNFEAVVVFAPDKPVKAPSVKVDCSKAKKDFGFEAKTSLSVGIEKTIKWLKEER